MSYIVKSQVRDMLPLSKTRETFRSAYLEARMLLSEGENYVEIMEQPSGAVVWHSNTLDMFGDFERCMSLVGEGEESMKRLSLEMSSESFWVD